MSDKRPSKIDEFRDAHPGDLEHLREVLLAIIDSPDSKPKEKTDAAVALAKLHGGYRPAPKPPDLPKHVDEVQKFELRPEVEAMIDKIIAGGNK